MTVASKKAPITTASMTTESGTHWQLLYYVQSYETTNGKKMYGIKVDKLHPDGTEESSAETFAISPDHNKVLAMIYSFAKGAVSPLTLNDVVADWSEYESVATYQMEA